MINYIKCILFVLSVAFILSSCSGKEDGKEIEKAPSTVNNQPISSITNSSITSSAPKDIDNESIKLSENSFDVENWKHPTKDILQKFGIRIIKMELLNHDTYPVFYVEFTKELKKENIEYFDNLIEELSKANSYWSYQVIDEKRSIIIEVTCNQKMKTVTDVSVNGNKAYFDELHGDTDKNLNKDKLLEIMQINRKDAGLSTIEPFDFGELGINNRIKELLFDSQKYENNDYKNGIIQDSGYILCERFKDTIIEDIKIGTDIMYVKKVLGKPNVTKDDYIFYKTKDFYLGFKGKAKVENAIFSKRSTEYNSSILKTVIVQLNMNQCSLMDAVYNNKTLSDFFESSGHIHGGGWYANSSYGMAIEEFDENRITIYNNFEGDLFKIKNFEYDIKYEDSDYKVCKAISSIDSYIWNNKEFDVSGILSPSGKLKCTFLWGNSVIHYFTIKTLDNSVPDFTLGAPAGDFMWLSDSYILYLNAWTSAPYIVKVSNDDLYNDINIMYSLGVFKEDDYFQDFSFSFSIEGIKDNIITFFDEQNDKKYKVEYSFDVNNKIMLKLIE